MRKILHIIPVLFLMACGGEQAKEVIEPTGNAEFTRVEPPFWWVGMKNPMVEILVYHENIQDYQVKQNPYKGVKVETVTRLDNPNYVFLEVIIDEKAQAGKVPLIFEKGEEKLLLEYELKEKVVADNRIQGLDNSDMIYLLFPDRFSNGNTSNDIVAGMRQGVNRDEPLERHGGDIQGIMNHLDYLKELGVTAIWFNPMLENDEPHESYHGYATTDHYNIDRRFGTNEEYLKLVDMCHERGIKVIMDVIHNHVGDKHWFIEDLPAKDWIHQFDTFTKTTYRAPTLMDPYASKMDKHLMNNGWFDKHMPDLNQDNPHVARYLTQNNLWWIEYAGTDAFRIDTYAYPSPDFTSNWCKSILEEYPQFGMFGETWVHGPAVQAHFVGNNGFKNAQNTNLPAVTDFQMYYAINEAINKEQGWTDGAARIYYTLAQDFLYEDPYRNILFLDNHDLWRYYASVGQDFDKYQLGLAFIMTMRGIPSMYYGTEILMFNQSGNHGHLRNDFPGGWQGDAANKFTKEGRTEQENAAFDYVKKLIAYRSATSALQTGKLTQFVPENGIYCYFRYDDEKTVMVIFNFHGEDAIVDTKRFKEHLEGHSKAKNIITNETIEDLSSLEMKGRSVMILELN